MINEIKLIEELLNNDNNALKVFFKKYGGIIKGAVSEVDIRSAVMDTDDVFMQTITFLLEGDKKVFRSFKGKSKLSTYLYVVCKRYAIQLVSKEHKILKNTDAEIFDRIPAPLADEINDLDDEKIKILQEAINSCKPDKKLLIQMLFYDQRPTDEIREMFGWNSNNTVFSQKNKTIKLLRKKVKRILLRKNRL